MSNGAEREASQAAPAVETAKTLLEEVFERTKVEQDRRKEAGEQIQELAKQALEGTLRRDKNLDLAIKARIKEIEDKLHQQLDEILHNPDFQKLEASWRGLHHLVMKTETSPMLQIKVLSITKDELAKDYEDSGMSPIHSNLFKKVYGEFDMWGAEPFGALLGDFEFGPKDIPVLDYISKVAASAHAPFVAAASPKMFKLNSFTELDAHRSLEDLFTQADYAQWKSFRETEDSRYVGLVLPHFMARSPYDPEDPVSKSEILQNYKEKVTGRDTSKYLWGNAAYTFGARLTDAFQHYGICVAIQGPNSGGRVEGLPTHTFQTDEGALALKCPTEIAIGGIREHDLAKLGFITLCHCKGTDYAAFFSAQSAQKPSRFIGPDAKKAEASAELSAQLQYVFAISRFSHYLKAQMVEELGRFTSRQKLETNLHNWINEYVTADDDAPDHVKAEKPLREAQVTVEDVEGRPGYYRAVAWLRPHFMLRGLEQNLRLVAEMPVKK